MFSVVATVRQIGLRVRFRQLPAVCLQRLRVGCPPDSLRPLCVVGTGSPRFFSVPAAVRQIGLRVRFRQLLGMPGKRLRVGVRRIPSGRCVLRYRIPRSFSVRGHCPADRPAGSLSPAPAESASAFRVGVVGFLQPLRVAVQVTEIVQRHGHVGQICLRVRFRQLPLVCLQRLRGRRRAASFRPLRVAVQNTQIVQRGGHVRQIGLRVRFRQLRGESAAPPCRRRRIPSAAACRRTDYRDCSALWPRPADRPAGSLSPAPAESAAPPCRRRSDSFSRCVCGTESPRLFSVWPRPADRPADSLSPAPAESAGPPCRRRRIPSAAECRVQVTEIVQRSGHVRQIGLRVRFRQLSVCR